MSILVIGVNHRSGPLSVLERLTVSHDELPKAVDRLARLDTVREAVLIRDTVEMFPHSTRPARHLDLDHTVPYRPGLAGQTGPANLGPLTRRVHRAKTARRWTLRQPSGGVFWWTSPHHQAYRVSNHRTDDLQHWSSAERILRWHLDAHPPPA